MTPGDRQGTPQDRSGEGTGDALHRAFPPDAARDDALESLINQLDGLNWPSAEQGESKP